MQRDDFGTEPMFTMEPTPQDQKPRGIKSIAFGKCPACINRDRVGIIRAQSHLIWRDHTIQTWAGVIRPCIAAGAPICQAHDRNTPRLRCFCERAYAR